MCVSPRRWLRAFAVIGATALLLASSCYLAARPVYPRGRAAAGRGPGAAGRHARQRPARRPAACWAEQRAAALEIPVTALEAYGYAARVAEVENPKCHIAWTTLAGIGQVESHHGTYRDATLFPNGDVTSADQGCASRRHQRHHAHRRQRGQTGPTASRARRGRWDRCSSFPRPGGYTGWTPTTTASSARTTSTTPHSRRRAICVGAERISPHPRGWITALWAYNDSDVYARAVRDWATAYAAGHPL